jgi:site-specific recombinase XerD
MEQVQYIINEFKDRNDFRMMIICSLLFRCVRIGDCVKTIKIQDIYEKDGTPKKILEYSEEKTGKRRLLNIEGENFLYALKNYHPEINKRKRDAVLFYQSKEKKMPLNDSGVKFLLRQFLGKRGIEQCSPHSFRKGGSRTMYEAGIPIDNIRNVLNHSSNRTTEIYMSITPKDISESMKCLAI